MNAPSSFDSASGIPDVPGGWEEVGRYGTEREAAEHGLVVLAMRRDYWLEIAPAGYRVWVESPIADEVRAQLALFDRESAQWPPRPQPLPRLRFAWGLPLLWATANIVVFRGQALWPGWLEEAGALEGRGLFYRGEWWRPITALFLHGDIGHLVANLGSGFFLFGLLIGMVGRWRGAFWLAAASVAGNLAAALLHPLDGYQSIGASTAVFAALGLLTGRALRDAGARRRGFSLRAVLFPLLAGASLLALHGAGDMRTDVVAHGTGFAAGLLCGLFLRPPARA